MSRAPRPNKKKKKQVYMRRKVYKPRSERVQRFRRQQAEQTGKRGSRLQQECPVLENNL